ncbi:rhomboid family intramembrane serine protease [Virgibacillus alimentarius]|uniref:Rhomboid protease GluP n=1 Tax=Virgibacillus alimentarius TaxID=698769 RepID=A0ABS4S4T9_9BACI|nr:MULTISPECIES: rhomboid family intramembrane serine protease [Virgibacillus]MBP2256510.1 rhomboid protease GluP [Virgibacillus alimentarius]HLR66456.1 rhomboid family intramembrane serine protease [Virgibacillus sp.]
MALDEKLMYQLAYNLVANNGYHILYINEKQEEIWLEKLEQKTSKIFRFVHQGFDWKNYLKQDIAIVFQKIKAAKHLLLGKHIEIHNVYISPYSPVDDWEMLKKPMQLNEKKSVRMQVYYLDEHHFNDEKEKLKKIVDMSSVEPVKNNPDEESINKYKTYLANTYYNQLQSTENVLSYGKPFFTYLLILINTIMFFLLELNGGSQNIATLIYYGANYNPALLDGQWWRILTSMFLHIGFAHLFMNMLALFYLGTIVEKIYGSWRFILIYFMAGAGGGLASFAFTISVSAGASGALFGLFGALLFFGLIYKKLFFQTMGKGLLIIIGINLIFGFLVPQIDNGAHLGGLLTGFLATAIIYLPNKKNFLVQVSALIIYVLIITGLVILGVT